MVEMAERYPEAEITGIDISQESAQKTREKTASYDNVEILKSSLNQFEADREYDAVLASNSIQAMENPGGAFSNIHNLLSDSSNLVFTVPSTDLGQLFPKKAVFYDQELEISGINTPLDLEDQTIDYSQYLIDKDWLRRTSEETGFSDFYAETSIPVNLDGIEYLQQIIHEEYKPDMERITEENDAEPETTLWVMQK
jgi:ubiquinone/menaquinone biosynthesis C-methylase UbiE